MNVSRPITRNRHIDAGVFVGFVVPRLLDRQGTPRARAGSESTASPRRAEAALPLWLAAVAHPYCICQDDTPSELTWNPLDLHPDFFLSQGLEEGHSILRKHCCSLFLLELGRVLAMFASRDSELAWDPIGISSADKLRLRASVDHEALVEGNVIALELSIQLYRV